MTAGGADGAGSSGANARRRPPGPSLLALSAIAMRMPNSPYTLLPEIARRYGDIVNIPIPVPGMTVTLLSHPDHVEHVMTRKHTGYVKHESTRELFFGEPAPFGLLAGEEWRRVRRSLSPHFGGQALTAVSSQLTGALTERVSAWSRYADSGQSMELQDELGVVVLDGLLRSMFSTALPTERLRRFATAAQHYDQYVAARVATYFLPGFLPRPYRFRGEPAKRFLFAQADDFVARRLREGPRRTPDVLDTLLSTSYEGSQEHQYARLRADLFSLMLGAVGTTTAAVGWAVGLLFANPPALARAYDEVDALGGAELGFGQLQNLEYLQCCLDEAQRIQSASPANVRTAVDDDEVGGYHIPAGSQILLSPYGLHRDTRFWDAPEEFRPSRFVGHETNRNAFLPFNVGPRKCMGYRLANTAGVLTLAAILQRYSVELPPEWRPRHEFRRASKVPRGLSVTLSHRRLVRSASTH
ncbi:cytochrome P450 [Mycobacterium sp. SMC-4]|uniref:cytochrome P450 n=1 Tax=Mycobacterium sp. SMC-4 TaxID=2857059 RepID=UPI003CFFAA39